MHDVKLSGKKVDQERRENSKHKIGPRKVRGSYSRFRIIAERRQTKPERNMQSRVAITVTKVPLSGAE